MSITLDWDQEGKQMQDEKEEKEEKEQKQDTNLFNDEDTVLQQLFL